MFREDPLFLNTTWSEINVFTVPDADSTPCSRHPAELVEFSTELADQVSWVFRVIRGYERFSFFMRKVAGKCRGRGRHERIAGCGGGWDVGAHDGDVGGDGRWRKSSMMCKMVGRGKIARIS